MSKQAMLPPFDADARCPKCGHDEIRTAYQHRDGYHCRNVSAPVGPRAPRGTCWFVEDEHFHRCCTRCHYEWAEGVLAPVPVEEEKP